jgi:hypothetical protein
VPLARERAVAEMGQDSTRHRRVLREHVALAQALAGPPVLLQTCHNPSTSSSTILVL